MGWRAGVLIVLVTLILSPPVFGYGAPSATVAPVEYYELILTSFLPLKDGALVGGYVYDTRYDREGNAFALIRLSGSGKVKWLKKYGLSMIPNVLVRAKDGFFVIGDGTVIKVDEDGEVLWAKRFKASSFPRFEDALLTKGGALVLVGTRWGGEKTPHVAWILAISQDGNVKWHRTYRAGAFTSFSAVVDTGDSIAVVGQVGRENSSDIWVLEFSYGGELLGQRKLDVGGFDIPDGALPSNGDLLIYGRRIDDNRTEAFVIRFGDKAFAELYPGRREGFLHGAIVDGSPLIWGVFNESQAVLFPEDKRMVFFNRTIVGVTGDYVVLAEKRVVDLTKPGVDALLNLKKLSSGRIENVSPLEKITVKEGEVSFEVVKRTLKASDIVLSREGATVGDVGYYSDRWHEVWLYSIKDGTLAGIVQRGNVVAAGHVGFLRDKALVVTADKDEINATVLTALNGAEIQDVETDGDTILVGTVFEGNVVSLGKALIAKLSLNGDVVWAKKYEIDERTSASAAAVKDGKIAIVGETINNVGDKNAFVMLLDGNGDVLWYRVFGGSLSDSLKDVAFDGEGNIVAVGYLNGGGRPVKRKPWILSLSPEGKVRWSKVLNVTYGQFTSVEAHGKSIFAAGYAWKISMPGSYGLFLELSQNGSDVRAGRYDFGQTTMPSDVSVYRNLVYISGHTDGRPWIYVIAPNTQYRIDLELRRAEGAISGLYINESAGRIYFVGSASFYSDGWKIFMGWFSHNAPEYSNECLNITVKRGVLLKPLSAAIISQEPDPPATVYVSGLNVKERPWHLPVDVVKKEIPEGESSTPQSSSFRSLILLGLIMTFGFLIRALMTSK